MNLIKKFVYTDALRWYRKVWLGGGRLANNWITTGDTARANLPLQETHTQRISKHTLKYLGSLQSESSRRVGV